MSSFAWIMPNIKVRNKNVSFAHTHKKLYIEHGFARRQRSHVSILDGHRAQKSDGAVLSVRPKEVDADIEVNRPGF